MMNKQRTINVTVTKLFDGPFYTEGPAVDASGDFYCTTLTGKSILKMNASGNMTEWASSACPNGQIILPDGDHLVCDSAMGLVLRFDANGQFIKNESSKKCGELQVHVPNDLLIDNTGNLYFTDSIRHKGSVFFIGIDGEERVLVTGLDYPNGLVLSADEQTLYVAESYKNRIIQISLNKPGYAKDGFHLLIDLPVHQSGQEIQNLPDGLAMNSLGQLAVAHYGMGAIQLLSADGTLAATIETGLPYTSNLIFINDQTLMVTGGYGEPGPGAVLKVHI